MKYMIQKRFVSQKGISLVTLLLGVTLAVVLFAMIGQLVYISKHNYTQAKNIIGLNDNGREAIEFIKKNAQIAGFGVLQPVAARNVQLNSSSLSVAAGGYAVIPDWVYIGYYSENPPTAKFTNLVAGSNSTPFTCAGTMDSTLTLSALQFFSLQSYGLCYSQNPTPVAPYDKSQLIANPADTTAGCCGNGSACSTPIYNCGGTSLSQGAVYQKLMTPVCVGVNCAGANAVVWPSGDGPSGDVLTVYFSNPGPSNMTTLAGQTIAPATTQPAGSLSSYTFQVDSASETLQVIDSNLGTTPINIAGNIEYMAVLVGESDLYTANTNGDLIPQMNRYVAYNTSNLYPYRIAALRVGIVVRSQDQILPSVPANLNIPVLLGNDGNPIVYVAPSDQYMRQVYTTTIYLNSYKMPDYLPHCVNVGGNYYLKTGGIPFATTWTANDQCCGGAPCVTTTDFNTCEANRMTGTCQ